MTCRTLRSVLIVLTLMLFGSQLRAQTYNMCGSDGPFAVLGVDIQENGSCEVRDPDGGVIFTGRMGTPAGGVIPFFGQFAGYDIMLVLYEGAGGFTKWAVVLLGPPDIEIGSGPLTPL